MLTIIVRLTDEQTTHNPPTETKLLDRSNNRRHRSHPIPLSKLLGILRRINNIHSKHHSQLRIGYSEFTNVRLDRPANLGRQNPLKRKGVLLITVFPVVFGLALNNALSVTSGLRPLESTIPELALQTAVATLLIFSYVNAGRLNR